jgi:hypothetical protein
MKKRAKARGKTSKRATKDMAASAGAAVRGGLPAVQAAREVARSQKESGLVVESYSLGLSKW